MDIVLLTLILTGIIACYFYLVRNYNYWHEQFIPYMKKPLPGVGNVWPLVSMQMSISDFIGEIYKSYSDRSMIGFYYKTIPALVIREPCLIKTVMQTEFKSFSENFVKLDMDLDPLFALNPFFSTGDKWHISRKYLLQGTTSQNLKIMYRSIQQVCTKLENFLDRKLKRNNGVIEFDLKNLLYKYTTEVAANAGFGVEGFCFEDESYPMSFAELGKSMLEINLLSRIVETLNFYLPELNSIVQLPYASKEVIHFFRGIIHEVLHARNREENAPSSNFLQMMLDMKKTESEKFDENTLISQAFTFFFNVCDTSCITMNFTLYQLARHPQVQQILRDEVEDVLERYGGQLTYESLKEMTYLDQVINESQRFHATAAVVGKICTQECELKGSDGLRCRVQPGTHVFVPIGGLHRDAKYWPDPDVFDPDRFAADRKVKIEKYTYLPFGAGPRICPGMRFALLQTKACLATITRKYSLEVSPKIQEPLKMMSGKFVTVPVDGLRVCFKHI